METFLPQGPTLPLCAGPLNFSGRPCKGVEGGRVGGGVVEGGGWQGGGVAGWKVVWWARLYLKMEADHNWSPEMRLQGCAGSVVVDM